MYLEFLFYYHSDIYVSNIKLWLLQETHLHICKQNVLCFGICQLNSLLIQIFLKLYKLKKCELSSDFISSVRSSIFVRNSVAYLSERNFISLYNSVFISLNIIYISQNSYIVSQPALRAVRILSVMLMQFIEIQYPFV